MSRWCAERTCEEALAELEKASIVAGQVYSPQQALDDAHIRAAHLLEERDYPGLDQHRAAGPDPDRTVRDARDLSPAGAAARRAHGRRSSRAWAIAPARSPRCAPKGSSDEQGFRQGNRRRRDRPADDAPAIPQGVKNYMTPEGHRRMQDELRRLLREERPKTVEIVSWAAGNGDRSENGDYLYGKKRLREIDRRIRFLTKRLESAEIVDPARQTRRDQVFFGATVTYAGTRRGREDGHDRRHRRGRSRPRPGQLDFPDRPRPAEGARGRHRRSAHPVRHRTDRDRRNPL